MKRTFPVLLLVAACTSPAPDYVAEPIQYVRVTPGFDSVASCEAERQDPLFACTQTIELCPDGGIAVALTDFVATGSYWIYDTELTASLDTFSDRVVFTIRDNGALVSDDLDPRPFEPTSNPPIRCAAPQ